MNLTIHSHTAKSLFKNFRKSWKLFVGLILGISIILLSGSYVYIHKNKTVPLTYSSESTISLAPKTDQKTIDGSFLQIYLNTEKNILGSDKIENYITDNIQKDIKIPSKDVIDYNFTNIDGTTLIKIKSTSRTNNESLKINKYITKIIIENKFNVLQDGKSKLVDQDKKATPDFTVVSHKKHYIISIIVSIIVSFFITMLKIYYDPKIYDMKLLNGLTKNEFIYESEESDIYNTLNKIFKKLNVLSNKANPEVTISYFEDDFFKILNRFINQPKFENISIFYSDRHSNQNSLNNLMSSGNEEDKQIKIIDCTQAYNTSNDKFQILIVKDEKTTKQNISKLINELNIIPNISIFIVYVK